jgi:hypothetical protein
MTDNVLPFPQKMKDGVNDQQWKELQAEFYLDCYFAANGAPARAPEELQKWLLEARISADIENPFFRGWLVRRLSEESAVS